MNRFEPRVLSLLNIKQRKEDHPNNRQVGITGGVASDIFTGNVKNYQFFCVR